MESNFDLVFALFTVFTGGFLVGAIVTVLFYRRNPDLYFMNASAEARVLALLKAANKAKNTEDDV